MTRTSMLTLAVTLLVTVSATPTHADLYSFSSITYAGAADTSTYGINDSGQIAAGYALLGDRNVTQGLLLSGGTFSPVTVPGSVETKVMGINDSGQIVGYYLDGEHPTASFVYNGTSFTTYANITFSGINNLGQIVGFGNSGPPTAGFLFNGTTYQPINYPGTPGSTETEPYGVNAQGQIIGLYLDYHTGALGNFFFNGTSFTSISFPGAVGTSLHAINDNGVIVGGYNDPSAV